MRIQTIHANALGDVLNESSATGFRITDDRGNVAELRNDMTVRVNGATYSVEYLADIAHALRLAPIRKQTCYQCDQDVTWLAPDGRCASCTRTTPAEVTGSAPD